MIIIFRDSFQIELFKSEETDSVNNENNKIGPKIYITRQSNNLNAGTLSLGPPSKRKKKNQSLTRNADWKDFVYEALTGCPGTNIEYLGQGGCGKVSLLILTFVYFTI